MNAKVPKSWPPRKLCRNCQPGKSFFAHSDDQQDELPRCLELIDQRFINGVRVTVHCACDQKMPVPYDFSVKHVRKRAAK